MKPIYTVEKKYRIDGDTNALTIRETKGSAYFVLNVDEANEVIEAMKETLSILKQQVQDEIDAAAKKQAEALLAKPAALASKMEKRPPVAAAPPVIVEETPTQYVWRVEPGIEIDATEAPEWATRVAQIQLTPNLKLRAWVNAYDTMYQYLPNYSGVSPHGKEIEDEFIGWDWDADVIIVATLEEIK